MQINSSVYDKNTNFINNVILPVDYHFSLQLWFR